MLWLIAFFLIAGWLAWSFYRRRCPRCGSFATGQFEYEWSCDNCHHIW
jgi:ribosomal protein S27AE